MSKERPFAKDSLWIWILNTRIWILWQASFSPQLPTTGRNGWSDASWSSALIILCYCFCRKKVQGKTKVLIFLRYLRITVLRLARTVFPNCLPHDHDCERLSTLSLQTQCVMLAGSCSEREKKKDFYYATCSWVSRKGMVWSVCPSDGTCEWTNCHIYNPGYM